MITPPSALPQPTPATLPADLLALPLRPGDIVVTSGNGRDRIAKLIEWATNSTWTHAFLVLDEDTLMESAFPHGVRTAPLAARFEDLAAAGQVWRVLRKPGLAPADEARIVAAAQRLTGRRYDILQAIIYGLFHRFVDDGPLRLTCARFLSETYRLAGEDLFTIARVRAAAGAGFIRAAQLAKGWVIPDDFLDYADMICVSGGAPLQPSK